MADRAPRPSKGPNGRPRRFVLPDEDDARTIEAIEGFVVGHRPRRRGPSPSVLALRGRGSALLRPDPFAALEARLAWLEAVAREEARHARYRRPVTVVVIEVRAGTGPEAGHVTPALVRRFVELVRRETRPTDRITRLGPARFAILLPETNELQAGHLVERLRDRAVVAADGQPALLVHAGWASPRRGEMLHEAIVKAEERLATHLDGRART